MHRTALPLAISLIATALGVVGAAAQTPTDPNPKTNPKTTLPPPPAATKLQASGRTKSCSAFGAGFVQVPGTDACVKIGGFVTTEATGH
jgi:Porin subfamily